MILRLSAVLAALLAAAPSSGQKPAAAPPEAPVVTLAQARASTAGAWQGELQYLDYQSGEWQGIPVTVTIMVAGDGNTVSRRAQFDDGPSVGMVYITSMSMLGPDGTTEYSTSFRSGRTPELSTYTLTLSAADAAEHWTMLAMRDGEDDDRPARIRETTTRDGVGLTTLKEVDFLDDTRAEWLVRNRTVLERTGP